MRFREYTVRLEGELSSVKLRILQRLWDEGEDFPKGWVRSSELLSLTGQKYFDRRIRELRDEVGCHIESGQHGGEHAYRLISASITLANPRQYLSGTQKERLFEASRFTCAVCGRRMQPGHRGLQADHRVPLIRGGSHDLGNWQALCVECNVGKRRACAGCSLDCQQCPWAFPERSVRKRLVSIPSELDAAMQQQADSDGKQVEEMIVETLRIRFLRTT